MSSKRHTDRPAPITGVFLMDIHDVASTFRCSERQAHKIVREPNFPAPVIKLDRMKRWRSTDIEAHVAELGN